MHTCIRFGPSPPPQPLGLPALNRAPPPPPPHPRPPASSFCAPATARPPCGQRSASARPCSQTWCPARRTTAPKSQRCVAAAPASRQGGGVEVVSSRVEVHQQGGGCQQQG
eukprot:357877-Chlamydomonas_euryale.AAC.8